MPGNSNLVPMTNFAGYSLIVRLCVGKSALAQTLADEALSVLGRLEAGDQRLHETVDANAAAASGQESDCCVVSAVSGGTPLLWVSWVINMPNGVKSVPYPCCEGV
jgi:hypothetical protein